MMLDIDNFIQQVKHNCNISDAQFWGYYSICGLLMRYRELYRTEHGLQPWNHIDNADVCRWIQERERLWLELEDAELQPVIVAGKSFDPFDITGLNAILRPEGLLYGAGYGTFGKPTFFIARLETFKELLDYRIHYAGAELCRDLAAAPAMLQSSCIYVRPEVLSIYIWDRFQEMKANRGGCLPERIFSSYGMKISDEDGPELFSKITQLVRDLSEVFVLHELGEAFEDEFAEDWTEILSIGCDKATELYLRGIKDVRADTSYKGPLRMLYESRDSAGIAFFVSFLDGIRKEIFPEIRECFNRFVESGDWLVLEHARRTGYERAERLQKEIVELWRIKKDLTEIAQYIRNNIRDRRDRAENSGHR